MVWPGWRCSSLWLLSELEITQRAHETREDRFERRDVFEAILTGTEDTNKSFTVKSLFRRFLFRPSKLKS